ncbi:glutathione S-transferase [Auriculariales sp. MPI-PUGE-AT-0066]|nr:glutathione S-transferase [Auriculariales sp. MPI-PUGE-AT-0066]
MAANPVVIIGTSMSSCTRRVAAICKFVGVEYTIREVSLDNLKTPEHLSLHPFGQIPVLEDPEDGFLVYGKSESRAIARYIVQNYAPGSTLVPRADDARAVARFEAVCSVEMADFDGIVSELVHETLFKRWFGGVVDEARCKVLASQLQPKLDGYERILSKSTYLAGETLTLADLFHLPFAYMLEKHMESDEMQKRPNVARWWNDISSRPEWIAVRDGA